jgi:hypothetical protein
MRGGAAPGQQETAGRDNEQVFEVCFHKLKTLRSAFGLVQRRTSATPRHWRPARNKEVIAGLAAGAF